MAFDTVLPLDRLRPSKYATPTLSSATLTNDDDDLDWSSKRSSFDDSGMVQPPHAVHAAVHATLAGDPIGLTAVWAPPRPIVDIIFVHGLGGKSGKTWCCNNDLGTFWPSWLHEEQELSRARVHTFGYSASIAGSANASGIFDFARDLLFKMKFEYVNRGKDPAIGSCPIIFVAHSMGGLVTKMAYNTGSKDDEFKEMVAQVKAIIFLSTPHRGCTSAAYVDTLLRTFNLSHDYIEQLSANGAFLQNINHDFSNLCGDLKLFSFYETAKTSIARVNTYIVNKDSGVMDLPNEARVSMAVDHQAMCKFRNREDQGYKYIRNTLMSLTMPLLELETSHISIPFNEEKLNQRLGDVLSINEHDLADEFDRFRNMAKQGTCKWIEDREWFKDWLRLDMDTPRILWISGAPAAGKSVLAASTANKIRKIYGQGSCQYHNLPFGNGTKRSASYLLRSLAFQIASNKPLFRKQLVQLSEEFKVPFGNMNATILWEKIFPGLLFRLMPERPLYWIIDGLDESDSIPTIFQCLNRIESDSLTLKIMLVSRPTADITMKVKSLSPLKCHIHFITLADTEGDIRAYVNDLVPSIIPGDDLHHTTIINKILSRASGNFLWVVLVLKALEQNWYTKSDIDRVIREFHSGMTPIYARMMRKLDEQIPRNRKMASLILIWAAFSFRPLSIVELRTALEPEFEDLTSLEDIVHHVCGGFVQVRGSKVGLIHETAKHFLINETTENKIQMTPSRSHEYLAIACLQYLSSTKERQWRTLLKHVEDNQEPTQRNITCSSNVIDRNHPFLMYAAKSWAYHLSSARTESSKLQSTLSEFFKKDTLTWINMLALLGDLKTLISSAQYLKTFIKRREKARAEATSANLQEDDLENLRFWAVDLSRLVGKFGSILLMSPSTIYKHVPAFCPDNSMIRRVFGRTNNAFSVVGISNPDWDDCHARLSVDPDDTASRLLATVDIFAALVPQAHSLVVWHTETCEEIRRINHGEYLIEMAINKKGDRICTAGIQTIKIWDVKTGCHLASNPKTSDTHVIAIAFGIRDSEILVGYQDYTVTCYEWMTHERIFDFRACPEGGIYGGLKIMKFSPDGMQVAFGSKGIPIEIWDLRRQARAHRYMIQQDAAGAESENLLPPEAIQWHPEVERVYILYHNMRLVDWNPTFEEQTEYQIGAKEMVCSPCGNFLLTSDNRGAIRIFSLPDYVSEQDSKFRLIYHLEYDELVRDLAFHPDGQRFYDIRGTICNVWEPEALVQADALGAEEESSNVGSLMSSGPAEAFQDDCSQITAIASEPKDFAFCCGRDDGTLSIHEMKSGKRLRSLPGHATDAAIIALKWSRSGNWVASADDSGHVLVRKVQMPSASHPNLLIWKASDFRIEDGIVQLLISPDDKHVLVVGSLSVTLWDVKNKIICQHRRLTPHTQGRWIEHPKALECLVMVCSKDVHIFTWEELQPLTPKSGLPLYRDAIEAVPSIEPATGLHSAQMAFTDTTLHSTLFSPNNSDPPEVVSSVIRTRDGQSLIFEFGALFAQGQKRHGKKRIELFHTLDLEFPKDKEEYRIPLRGTISELSGLLCRVIGSYQNQVIFFDHQHWLCSWDLDTNGASHRKHLSLPQDWLNAETLNLTTLTPMGTLLCPRNGEVAIIKGWIKI